jgi:radical SAM protein with 4Fe4S-binding SPASM domain
MKALSKANPTSHVTWRTGVHFWLPLKGFLDLTYRCNNNCLHCWLKVEETEPIFQDELSTQEWIHLIDQARALGAREWHLSGGEPMARPDFTEILTHLTRKAAGITINTNGTLITPGIAQLLKGINGAILVALYGADAEVHDHITRQPGSFAAMQRGCAYLQEAKVPFIVQVVPMRDNHHQVQDMIKAATRLSPAWRMGIDVLHLAGARIPERNCRIQQQRLSPFDAIQLVKPQLLYEGSEGLRQEESCAGQTEGQHPLVNCILNREEFHVDPYGQMSFCPLIKDPAFRHDVRRGSFKEGWESFLPSLLEQVKNSAERNSCGVCSLSDFCGWCPAFTYLESGSYTAKVDYLCQVAAEKKIFLADWVKHHRRYYQVAGITIQVTSELPITDTTFLPVFKQFEVETPGNDVVAITHHFQLPEVNPGNMGKLIFQIPPWTVYQKNDAWFFLAKPSGPGQDGELNMVAVFNHDLSRARIYSDNLDAFNKSPMSSLTFWATDQIFLAMILPRRQACILHSSGLIFKGHGLLFVGHSEAGKSTICKLFGARAEILCDDRNVVRKWPEGYRIHGTWSHGELPEVSAGAAPLFGIFFLEKSTENEILAMADKASIRKALLACLIRSFTPIDWWEKMLRLLEQIADEVPCYRLKFDTSGEIVNKLEAFMAPDPR